jgi:hypothetical protein
MTRADQNLNDCFNINAAVRFAIQVAMEFDDDHLAVANAKGCLHRTKFDAGQCRAIDPSSMVLRMEVRWAIAPIQA